ncbi:glycerophosphoryl diester phosphodiesterase, partial [Candidatus Bathyarchaeota archaeon]|nr:glycerophosphoryl diester phosphodiesterase [Candidatus Bathyarchaeota archaeon]
LGADMVELDVHLCATGEPVVIHDDTVDRTTDGSGRVRDLSLDDLRRLDAGGGERVLTLVEVIDEMSGRAALNVELKGLGCVDRVHEVISDAVGDGLLSQDKLLVSSFHLGMLEWMRALSDDVRLGVLVGDAPGKVLEFAQRVGAHSVNPYHKRMGLEFVSSAHGRGLKVYPWTVNEPGDIAKAKAMGVDGIISDYPERV